MKKVTLLFAGLALVVLSACGKKDGGGSNNNLYANTPGYCNNNGNQYSTGQYQWRNNICVNISTNQQVDPSACNNNGNNGVNNGQYYYQGNQCIDRYTGSAVDQYLCQQNQGNNWNNINCNNNSNIFPINGGNLYNAQNICSTYNRAGVTYYPLYYPGTGTTVCIGYSQVMTMYQSYGNWPMLYGNGSYGNMFEGCSNNSRCKCVSIGVGWLGAGAGICM